MRLNQSDKLKGAVLYLSGPINYSKDDGIGWRQEFIKSCNNEGLKFTYFDPTNKPPGLLGQEVGFEKQKAKRLKEGNRWTELHRYVKNYIRIDLRLVDLSDIVVVFCDTDTFMTGSWHEMFLSLGQKKPTFLICKKGKKDAPDWIFGLMDHKYIFNSVEECVYHLKKLNSGKIKLNKRFVLVRDYLEKEQLV